jgi:hypothetical protein
MEKLTEASVLTDSPKGRLKFGQDLKKNIYFP